MIAMMVVSMLATALVVMLSFPQTPAARTLHRIFVKAPVRFATALTWKKAGQLALSTAAFCLMMAMGPQMLLLMATMGLDAAFVEVLILMYLASVSGGIASAWRSLKAAAVRVLRFASRRLSRRSGQRQPSRRRKPRPQGRKDDSSEPESPPEWAFA